MAQEIKKKEATPAPSRSHSIHSPLYGPRWIACSNSFLGRGFGGRPTFCREGARGVVVPDIDIRESASELVFEAELPGMEEKDISLTLRNGVLTLKGEKKSERAEKDANFHLMERTYGSFQRSFELPDTVDEDKVSAAFQKGVLKITMLSAGSLRAERDDDWQELTAAHLGNLEKLQLLHPRP